MKGTVLVVGERTLDPRRSMLPAALAFLAGLVYHTVDQYLFFRAGPIPILVTAPTVAVLAYVAIAPGVSGRRIVGLLAWGGVGSGLAILTYFLVGVSYRLPRTPSGREMVLFDLVVFLWFVGALTASYAAAASIESAAGVRDRRPLAAIIAGPVLQATFILLVVALIEARRYVL
jgi:hypothetical protein